MKVVMFLIMTTHQGGISYSMTEFESLDVCHAAGVALYNVSLRLPKIKMEYDCGEQRWR